MVNQIPSFDAAATKWVTEFNGAKDEAELSTEHHSIAAYHKKGVFSIAHPGADTHMTVVGLDSIQKQWVAVRNMGCHQITKATGRKVVKLDETTLIQSYEHVEFSDRSGKYTMAIEILAEVWKVVDGEWKVMADYVMVKPAKQPMVNLESFDEAATAWVVAFNGAKDEAELSVKHPSIAAYDAKGVFSIAHPAADTHMTVTGMAKIQEQWKAVRGMGCHQITKATGRKVTPVDAETLIQSYDHVEFSDKEGKYVMAINILAEVWKLQDGKWTVMADYVMVKPASN